MSRLEAILEEGSNLVLPVIEGSQDVLIYIDCIKALIEELAGIPKEEIEKLPYEPEILKTLAMDQSVLGTAITKEGDQVSMVSTLLCYIQSCKEGLPKHSKVYMDRIVLVRDKIEAYYAEQVERFCGTDVCLG